MTGHPLGMAYGPRDTLIKEKDLKAVAATKYDTPVFDLKNWTTVLVRLSVTETGVSAAGACKLSLVVLADDDPSIELEVIDLLTAIDTTNSTEEAVVFGRASPAANRGTGTIGSNLEILRAGVGACKFRVEVTTANDGTTCVADLRLRCSQ